MNANLQTQYLGMTLRNPILVASCPLAGQLDVLRRMADAGAGAAVLPSVFEEQLEEEALNHQAMLGYGAAIAGEAFGFFPDMQNYNAGATGYLRILEQARLCVSIPIIASLNGYSTGGWVRHAKRMEDAGACAIELNIMFVPTDPEKTAYDVEEQYVDLVAQVRSVVSVPLAVKIGPYFTAPANVARKLFAAGADGLVLFNRYLDPDINLDNFEVTPRLSFSHLHEYRLPLRWTAILRDQTDRSLAATGGVRTVDDVVKLVLAGADVVMLACALYQCGPSVLTELVQGLTTWMEERDYDSLNQLRGRASMRNSPTPIGYQRANYMKALIGSTSPRPSTLQDAAVGGRD